MERSRFRPEVRSARFKNLRRDRRQVVAVVARSPAITMRCSHILRALSMAAVLVGCATHTQTPQASIVATQSPKNALAVEFDQVHFSHVRMTTALLVLSNVINQAPRGLPTFQWEVSWPNATTERGYLVSSDPEVSLEGKNVSLELILERLCSQAGWSYRKSVKGIEFAPAAMSQ